MIIGTIGYACHNGLGHLIRDFYRNGLIQRVMVVRHRAHLNYPEWYPKGVRLDPGEKEKFLDGLDCLLCFETPIYWDVMEEAKKRGIRTILIPMYEYSPCPGPVVPDLYLCPSLLDAQVFHEYPHVFLPVPVTQTWRQREYATEFVHNMGHGQFAYAKGTLTVIEAMKYVKAPIRLLIRGQNCDRRVQHVYNQYKDYVRLKWETGDLPDEKMFAEGDVYLNAEQWNGLSLPLQEAHAAGMLVMTSDRFPANSWLPTEPLIPVQSYHRFRIPGGSNLPFDRAEISPKDVAAKVDEFYGQDIARFSLAGKRWAEENSWEKLKPKYEEVLKG